MRRVIVPPSRVMSLYDLIVNKVKLTSILAPSPLRLRQPYRQARIGRPTEACFRCPIYQTLTSCGEKPSLGWSKYATLLGAGKVRVFLSQSTVLTLMWLAIIGKPGDHEPLCLSLSVSPPYLCKDICASFIYRGSQSQGLAPSDSSLANECP